MSDTMSKTQFGYWRRHCRAIMNMRRRLCVASILSFLIVFLLCLGKPQHIATWGHVWIAIGRGQVAVGTDSLDAGDPQGRLPLRRWIILRRSLYASPLDCWREIRWRYEYRDDIFGWSRSVPLWPSFVALSGAALLYPSVQKLVRQRRNQCVRCGYSLTGLGTREICPECGRIVDRKHLLKR